ncbi:hypothetical protein SDC9_139697 [bioreactor metagenome]|jgi:hypothetical protein|uniref:Uncharacterized protein n=1 Tax=bioreactor metagenome TaxID=1076179 RepID=A0A645DW44_9ZZZZ
MKRTVLESTPYEGLKSGSHLDVEVYYDKGGANYFCGGTTQRGYYVSVTPATHKNGMVSVVLFTGIKKLLLQTSRFSDKQFEQAVELGRAAAPELIAYVLEKEKAA